jgi:hypothetical protein
MCWQQLPSIAAVAIVVVWEGGRHQAPLLFLLDDGVTLIILVVVAIFFFILCEDIPTGISLLSICSQGEIFYFQQANRGCAAYAMLHLYV